MPDQTTISSFTPKTTNKKSQKQAPSYSAVFKVLSLDEGVCEKVLSAFRKTGGQKEVWNKKSIAAMAEAITKVEDWLDTPTHHFTKGQRKNSKLLRQSLRDIRRPLEVAAYP